MKRKANTPPVMYLTPPTAVLPDRDGDGVPDFLDCQPSNPHECGFWGDVSSRLRSAWRRAPVHVSYARAASRRATVRRAVVSTGRRVTRRVTTTAREAVRRAPIHVSPARAVRRRAAVRESVVRIARPVVGRAVTTAVPLVGAAAVMHRAVVGIRPVAERKVQEARAFITLPAAARRERMAVGAEAFLERQQKRAPRLSGITRRIHEETARVARVARGFEKPVMERVARAEEIAGVRIPTPVKEFVGGVAFEAPATMVEMAGMVPGGIETIVRRPSIVPAAAAYGTYTMGRGVWEGFTQRPLRTAGMFISMGAIAKAPSLSPIKIKPTLIRLPTAKGAAIGIETHRGPVTKFVPGVTIMPRATKLVTFGVPKVIKSVITEKPFTPKTALEARIVARAVGREAPKITEALAVRWETARAGVTIKEITPTVKEVLSHHGISKASSSAVMKTMRAHKGEIFGSVIQRAAGKRGLLRIPRDFDVVVKDPIKFAKDVAAKINKAEGRQVVRVEDGKVIVRKTGEKLFDIHSPETAPTSYLGRSEIAWGIRTEKLMKVEGVRMRSFSEQISRKLEGGMIVGQKRTLKSPLGSVSGRIVPKHEGRIKDIMDFYTGEKLAITRLRARGKTTSATKADVHLERWLDTWGGEVARNIRGAYREQLQTGIVSRIGFDFGAAEPGLAKISGYAPYSVSAYGVRYPPSVPSGIPAYTPPSAPPSVVATIKPSIPPSVPPYKPPYKPPSVPPYAPPYAPPSVPPSILAYTPPSVPPYKPPAVLPYAPPSVPPSILAYTPPSVPPYKPPSVPPYAPPSVPPYAPPSVPPYAPPSVPPIIIPKTPTIPFIPFIPTGEDKKKIRRKPRGKRGMFAWDVKNPIRAFFGEDARAGKDLKSIIGR